MVVEATWTLEEGLVVVAAQATFGRVAPALPTASSLPVEAVAGQGVQMEALAGETVDSVVDQAARAAALARHPSVEARLVGALEVEETVL